MATSHGHVAGLVWRRCYLFTCSKASDGMDAPVVVKSVKVFLTGGRQ